MTLLQVFDDEKQVEEMMRALEAPICEFVWNVPVSIG